MYSGNLFQRLAWSKQGKLLEVEMKAFISRLEQKWMQTEGMAEYMEIYRTACINVY